MTGNEINKIKQIDEEDPNEGIIIDYETSKQGNHLTLTLECDSSLTTKIKYYDPPKQVSEKEYTLTIRHKAGCPEIELS